MIVSIHQADREGYLVTSRVINNNVVTEHVLFGTDNLETAIRQLRRVFEEAQAAKSPPTTALDER